MDERNAALNFSYFLIKQKIKINRKEKLLILRMFGTFKSLYDLATRYERLCKFHQGSALTLNKYLL